MVKESDRDAIGFSKSRETALIRSNRVKQKIEISGQKSLKRYRGVKLNLLQLFGRCSGIKETFSTLNMKYCLVSINRENCQKGMRKHSNGGGNDAREYLTIRRSPYLSRHRTPNNVQLKWALERKQMAKAFRAGCDDIETEEGKASYKVLVNNG